MFRSGGDPRRRRGAGAALLAVALGGLAIGGACPAAATPGSAPAPPARSPARDPAQTPAPALPAQDDEALPAAGPAVGPAFELPPAAQQSLALLPQLWGQWLRAFYQDDPAALEKAVNDLLVTARQLGMRRLPDLALAASVRAIEAAREGDATRAARALTSAERLDPARPEAAFAAARVAHLGERPLAAALAVSRGYLRLFGPPVLRRMAFYGLASFAVFALLAGAVLFLAVQMATKGSALLSDLGRLLSGRLPRFLIYPVAVVLLLWPLVLPSGPLWLIVYWSILLWGYGSATERMVLVAAWLFAGAVPLMLVEMRPRLAMELSPPARAMAGLEQQRLYGELFADLEALPALFPEHPAVHQLLADLNLRLGDWSAARRFYQRVNEAEPDNADALIGLGGYYFRQDDFGTAIDYFRRAVTADPNNAAAYFDLSQAFSHQFWFDDMEAARARANALAPEQVSEWLSRTDAEPVQVPAGGLARVPELRRQLLAVERGRDSVTRRMAEARRWAALLAAAGVALAALALHLVRRPFGYGLPGPGPGPAAEHWLGALLPGYLAAEEGRGVRCLLAVLPLAVLLLLPLAPSLGTPLPVLFAPGTAPLTVIAGAGLALLLARGVWRGVRNR